MKNRIILNNNINFIYDDNPNLNTVVLSLFFKAGTFYETEKNFGVSHLIEHLFFRRLDDLPQKKLYLRMESIGATLKGRTYRDLVCFDINVIPEFFKEALEIISKVLSSFNWNDIDIEKEKEVVKKQIQFKVESFDEYVDRLYFDNVLYTVPIMGCLKNINKITKEEINKQKKRLFSCNNSCFILTGAFSKEDKQYAMDLLEKNQNFGPSVTPEIVYPNDLFNRTVFSDRIMPSNDNISDVWITFDVNLNNLNLDEVRMVSSILGEGVGSRLPYQLTDCTALTELITSRVNIYSNRFARIIISYSLFNRDLEKSLLLVFNTIEDLKSNITVEDYNSSIIFFTKNKIKLKDDAIELNFNYGWYDYIMDYDYDVDSSAYRNESISLRSLLRTAKKIFTKQNLVINVKNNNRILRNKKLSILLNQLRDLI